MLKVWSLDQPQYPLGADWEMHSLRPHPRTPESEFRMLTRFQWSCTYTVPFEKLCGDIVNPRRERPPLDLPRKKRTQQLP